MRLLFDECVPRALKFMFSPHGHDCVTVRDAGFAGKENGELLSLAESRFDVLITIDKNIRYQQNMSGRRLAILILRVPSNDIGDIRPLVPEALAALQTIRLGSIVEVGAGKKPGA